MTDPHTDAVSIEREPQCILPVEILERIVQDLLFPDRSSSAFSGFSLDSYQLHQIAARNYFHTLRARSMSRAAVLIRTDRRRRSVGSVRFKPRMCAYTHGFYDYMMRFAAISSAPSHHQPFRLGLFAFQLQDVLPEAPGRRPQI